MSSSSRSLWFNRRRSVNQSRALCIGLRTVGRDVFERRALLHSSIKRHGSVFRLKFRQVNRAFQFLYTLLTACSVIQTFTWRVMQRLAHRGALRYTIRYYVYLTCSKKLTDCQLSLSHGTNQKSNKCVSRTDTNPPFAFQTAFPRGTDFSVSTGRVKKLHTLLVSLYL